MSIRWLQVGLLALVMVFGVTLVLLGMPPPSWAQERQGKVQVYVTHSGDDVVGRELAYAVREEIRRSAGYQLADSADRAGIAVSVVSLDVECVGPGASSAVAVSYAMLPGSWNRHLVTHVLLVGRNRTESMARSVVSTVDNEATAIREILIKTLPPGSR